LQELSRKGLLLSAKGPTGGFFLDNSLLKQSLADIVSAVDGDRLFTGCGLGLKSCSEKKPCPIHDEFVAIRKKIKTVMQSAILGDYNTSLDLGEKYLKR